MRNSIYYIALAIISTIFFIYTLWKKKDRKLIALYFFTAGLTYFLELFVLVIFNGYAYYPGILKKQYFDNILGAIFSDAIAIPMFTVYIAGSKLKFMKRLLISLAFVGVEVLFVKVKVYDHFWWNYSYTFIGANIFFYFGRLWYKKLHKPISKGVSFITLFFSNLAIQGSCSFLLVSTFGKYYYVVNWFNNYYRGHTFFSNIYIIFTSLIFVTAIVLKLKWIWKCAAIIIPSIIDMILLNNHILMILNEWSLLNFLVFRIFIYVCLHFFHKLLLIRDY